MPDSPDETWKQMETKLYTFEAGGPNEVAASPLERSGYPSESVLGAITMPPKALHDMQLRQQRTLYLENSPSPDMDKGKQQLETSSPQQQMFTANISKEIVSIDKDNPLQDY
jgi:hypothetical protein